MSPLFDLSNQVAVITGSTKGIGLAAAEHMARCGAHVVISSRKEDSCQKVAETLRAQGLKATPIAANISKDEEIDKLLDETRRQVGPVNILVCNAAVNPYFGPFLDTPDDAFEKTIGVNIKSNMRLIKAAMPDFVSQGAGSVVVVSSIAAFKGSKNLGIYAVTKAADTQIIRNIAVAYGDKNIRVNGVAPAVVRTDFAKALWEDDMRAQTVADSYALKRLGTPDDIAGAIVFLASNASSWMTGQTLIIDGGWSINER